MKQSDDIETEYYWVYILYCANDTYYTGYTNNLDKRYQSHLDGSGRCKYTRSFKPLFIARSWKLSCNKAAAMKLERQIKKMTRKEKELIISKPALLDSLTNLIFVDN